jgi:hypothetical protein
MRRQHELKAVRHLLDAVLDRDARHFLPFVRPDYWRKADPQR